MSGTTRKVIEHGLAVGFDPTLVRELLDSYVEAKSNFYLGGLRLAWVQRRGHFFPCVFRMLQERALGAFDPLGKQLNAELISKTLANLPAGTYPDSIRLHIPRSLRVVYDVRNHRDAAHLADGIDPNLQDATLVVGVLDWVLAEFVRIEHDVTPQQAQQMVDDLVTGKHRSSRTSEGS